MQAMLPEGFPFHQFFNYFYILRGYVKLLYIGNLDSIVCGCLVGFVFIKLY